MEIFPNREYVVQLEKKGRERLVLKSPWAFRTFKLKGQYFSYFDGDVAKGCLEVDNAKCKILSPQQADNRYFAFALETFNRTLIMNAPDEATRSKCMELLKRASKSEDWDLPQKDDTVHVTTSVPLVVDPAGPESAAKQKLIEIKIEAERNRVVKRGALVTFVLKGFIAKRRFRAALKSGVKDDIKTTAHYYVLYTFLSTLIQRKILRGLTPLIKEDRTPLKLTAGDRAGWMKFGPINGPLNPERYVVLCAGALYVFDKPGGAMLERKIEMKDCDVWTHCKLNQVAVTNDGLLGNFELEAKTESAAKEWRVLMAQQIATATGNVLDVSRFSAAFDIHGNVVSGDSKVDDTAATTFAVAKMAIQSKEDPTGQQQQLKKRPSSRRKTTIL